MFAGLLTVPVSGTVELLSVAEAVPLRCVSPCAVVVFEVAPLNHEIVYDSVEGGEVVPELLGEQHEVLHVDGCVVLIELDLNERSHPLVLAWWHVGYLKGHHRVVIRSVEPVRDHLERD